MTKRTIFLSCLLAILFALINLFWLFLVLFILVLIFKKILALISKSFFKKGFVLFSLLFALIIIRLFIFDIFKIPSSSMEDTLFPKDIIIVNKLKYGPKLPRSPFDIPILNIAFYFNKKAKEKIKKNWWAYKRLSGYSNVKNGDIIVYENFRKNFFFVKRCVAIPGDTLYIKNGSVYINNTYHEFNNNIKKSYQFKIKNVDKFHRDIDALEITDCINIETDSLQYSTINLSIKKAKEMNQLSSIDSFGYTIKAFNENDKFFYRKNKEQWTIDNLGPIITPKKGMQIILNDKNFAIYHKALRKYEKVKIKRVNGTYFINDVIKDLYTFKQNYYFMMGDNRDETIDSRFFGFLPEKNIVGYVQGVFLSNYQDTFQWGRLFKSIY
ncbi:signal peptidase I [uncultured Algibacter sp.]|uniref:signal peptidase I n=1 Tax=uncultured Algibacter sp. TaxID=298659 RepID=UPI002628FA3F|nr:signal peptidase I [uncultured Algibacter sp.]